MINSLLTKVGIQIGEQHIKLVVIRRKRKEWVILKEMMEKLPKDIVKNGEVLQPEILGLKIKNILLTNKIRANHVSVFIEELLFFVRQIRLPKMPKKEVQKAIEYKAQLEIPVDVNDLIIRYYPLERQVSEDGESLEQYVLIAVYKSMIEKLVKAIHAAGLSIHVLGLEPESIYQGLTYKDKTYDFHKNVLIGRIDTNRMMLSVFTNGKLVYSRYLPFNLTKQDWEQEIERTIISWEATHRDQPLHEIILLGEKEYWGEIKQRIEEFIPKKVHIITSPFTACLGIALEYPMGTNFYYKSPPIPVFSGAPLYLKAGLLLLLLLAASGIYQYGAMFMLQNDIRVLKDNIYNNKEMEAIAVQKTRLLDIDRTLKQVVNDFEVRHADPLFAVRLLANNQPPETTISRIHYTRKEIVLSGQAAKQSEVMLFLKELQEDASLANVRLVQSSESGDDYRFSIRMEKK